MTERNGNHAEVNGVPAAQVPERCRKLAGQVEQLAATAFDHPGPLFDEPRKAIFKKWFANFARNLTAAAQALKGAQEPPTALSARQEVADGLVRMCGEYGKAEVRQRLQQVCGAEVHQKFDEILKQTVALASELRQPTPSARRPKPGTQQSGAQKQKPPVLQRRNIPPPEIRDGESFGTRPVEKDVERAARRARMVERCGCSVFFALACLILIATIVGGWHWLGVILFGLLVFGVLGIAGFALMDSWESALSRKWLNKIALRYEIEPADAEKIARRFKVGGTVEGLCDTLAHDAELSRRRPAAAHLGDLADCPFVSPGEMRLALRTLKDVILNVNEGKEGNQGLASDTTETLWRLHRRLAPKIVPDLVNSILRSDISAEVRTAVVTKTAEACAHLKPDGKSTPAVVDLLAGALEGCQDADAAVAALKGLGRLGEAARPGGKKIYELVLAMANGRAPRARSLGIWISYALTAMGENPQRSLVGIRQCLNPDVDAYKKQALTGAASMGLSLGADPGQVGALLQSDTFSKMAASQAAKAANEHKKDALSAVWMLGPKAASLEGEVRAILTSDAPEDVKDAAQSALDAIAGPGVG